LSQLELATACGVTQQFIQAIEKGLRTPSLRTARKLAAALGVTVDELIGKEEAS
jgi:transcriptional regulator with XRE-family HTH domain